MTTKAYKSTDNIFSRALMRKMPLVGGHSKGMWEEKQMCKDSVKLKWDAHEAKMFTTHEVRGLLKPFSEEAYSMWFCCTSHDHL